jgi:coenzyme F420-reducing hydrogenase beta subunit
MPNSSGAVERQTIQIAPAERKSLIEEVVDGGYCIGCGACTAVDPRISIEWNRYGDRVAKIPAAAAGDPLNASRVCPFATGSDETEIGLASFPDAVERSPILGSYQAIYKGYSQSYRRYGSSGGIGTHLLARALELQQIDAVICVGQTASSLAAYQRVDTIEQVIGCATSFYYPVTLEEVLTIIRDRPGRYAVTGVPCFHKALRLLKQEDPVLRERIVLQVGLVCGQMKSAHYAEYLARRAGLPPGAELKQINFRRKEGTPRADDYNFVADWQTAEGKAGSGKLGARSMGFNWGMSYFKPQACDFCDDVFAECADVAVMDAWLPGDVEDARGTSIVVARSAAVVSLLADEAANGAMALEAATAQQAIQSQEGGLRHRRQGLRFRLWLVQRSGGWFPRKRVQAKLRVGWVVAGEMLFRLWLRRASRDAYLAQRASGHGVQLFAQRMRLPVLAYKVFSKVRRKLDRHWPSKLGNQLEVDRGA